MTEADTSKLKMAMAALKGAMPDWSLDRTFGALAGDVRWSWDAIKELVPKLLKENAVLREVAAEIVFASDHYDRIHEPSTIPYDAVEQVRPLVADSLEMAATKEKYKDI